MIHHNFNCPYCSEEISFLLDNSVHELSYIEDCEVCCNPIEINAVINNGQLKSFSYKNINQ